MRKHVDYDRSPPLLREGYTNLIAVHGLWLETHSQKKADQWRKRILSDDQFEGALAEAWCGQLLARLVQNVIPADEPGPDYECRQGGETFYVEVTTIPIQNMTRLHGHRDISTTAGTVKGGYLNSIQNKIIKKQKQAGRNLNAPTLLMICTLHCRAGSSFGEESFVDDVLVSPSSFVIPMPAPGQIGGGEFVTNMMSAAFAGVTHEGLKDLRRNISGVLFCGVGAAATQELPNVESLTFVSGILHHNPTNRFEPSLLPMIRFKTMRQGPDARVSSDFVS